MEKILARKVFYVPSVADLPPEARAEKEHWEAQDIKSLITVPILMAGVVIGFLGFDEVRSEKQWGGNDITLLQTVGDILGNSIERQRANEKLQKALAKAEKARDKIEAILQSVADGLIFTDMDKRIILLSASTEAILGRKISEILLQPMAEAIENPALRKQIAAVQDNTIEESVMELDLPAEGQEAGQIIQVKSSLVRGKDGSKAGVITLLHDVSRERELDRIKNEFISTAAHELRTPLTSIRGYSQFLLTEDDLAKEQQTEFLNIINEKSMVLENIIDDLLDLSRVESGRLIHLEKDWHDPRPVLAELVGQYQKEFKTHRFETILPEKQVELLGDKGKIIQVMDNLLINAVKFSPEGSLIQVPCETSAKEVLISVIDEGIGMTAEQAGRVFDKFYRVDTSLMAREGLGLGMAIAKNIIEAHRGKIWVESEPGKGTTVTFSLPLEPETSNQG
jgi:PAS domain S-box-containing protein